MKLATDAQIKTPILIDYGEFNNKKYILMSKLKGDQLYKYWPTMSE